MKDDIPIFNRFDYLSEFVGFELHQHKNYKTFFGSFLSMSIFISTIVLTFNFGNDVYERKSPVVRQNSEYLDNSTFVLGKDMPFFFTITTVDGINKDINTHFKTSLYKVNTTNSTIDFSDKIRNSAIRCESRHFEGFKGLVSDEQINQHLNAQTFCFDLGDDLVVQNSLLSNNFSMISILFEKCNSEEQKCEEDLNDSISNIFINLYFLNTYVESTEYTNPVKYFIDYNIEKLSPGMLKTNFYRFTKEFFHSDDGFLVENSRKMEYLKFQNVMPHVELSNRKLENYLYQISFESPQLRGYYYREYMKIQSLFADIGGIINAMVMIVQLLFSHYLRFKYLHDVSCHIIDLNEGSKNTSGIYATNTMMNLSTLFNRNSKSIKSINPNNFDSQSNINMINQDLNPDNINNINNYNNYNNSNEDQPENRKTSKLILNIKEENKNINKEGEVQILDDNKNSYLQEMKTIKLKQSSGNFRSTKNGNADIPVEKVKLFNQEAYNSRISKLRDSNALRIELLQRWKDINYIDFVVKDLRLGTTKNSRLVEEVLNITYFHLDFFEKLK